jgi:uncharacterized protein
MVQPCTQCGKCCLKYGGCLGCASDEEMERWESEAPQILDWVQLSDMWISPNTGDDCSRCPWLRKRPNKTTYNCRIYNQRPEACREYPVNAEQAIGDGCEMIEASDFGRPLAAIDRDLDWVMGREGRH